MKARESKQTQQPQINKQQDTKKINQDQSITNKFMFNDREYSIKKRKHKKPTLQTTVNSMNEAEIIEQTQEISSGPYCIFPDNLSSTVSHNASQKKTFSDVISDSESIIHNLKISSGWNAKHINTNKSSSSHNNPFPFSPKIAETVTSKQEVESVTTDKFDATFSSNIVNPFVQPTNDQTEQRQLKQENFLFRKIQTIKDAKFKNNTD